LPQVGTTERYERSRPGELVDIDVKKLGRIERGAGKRILGGSSHYNRTYTDQTSRRRNTVGWDYVHVCVDDATRFAYVELLADERASTGVDFLRRAVRFFARHGVGVEAVLTDG
jgi:Integrase core domain